MTVTIARTHRLLIVDDDPMVLEYAHRVLSKAGYEATMASSADAALAMTATGEPVALLVTDVMMPDMHGDELARRLRLAQPDLKVLYITGFADKLFSTRPVLWKDEAFIEKPFTVEGLREAVSLALFGHTRGLEG